MLDGRVVDIKTESRLERTPSHNCSAITEEEGGAIYNLRPRNRNENYGNQYITLNINNEPRNHYQVYRLKHRQLSTVILCFLQWTWEEWVSFLSDNRG